MKPSLSQSEVVLMRVCVTPHSIFISALWHGCLCVQLYVKQRASTPACRPYAQNGGGRRERRYVSVCWFVGRVLSATVHVKIVHSDSLFLPSLLSPFSFPLTPLCCISFTKLSFSYTQCSPRTLLLVTPYLSSPL